MSFLSGLGNLLEKIIVTGSKAPVGGALGNAIGTAAGGAAAASGLGRNLGGGGGGSSSGGEDFVSDDVVVGGPGTAQYTDNGMGDWGGALSSVLANYNSPVEAQTPFDFSGMTPSSALTPQLANFDVPTELAGVEVMGRKNDLTAPVTPFIQDPLTNGAQLGEDDGSVEHDEPIDPNESEEDRKKRLLAKYGPLGLLGLLGTKGLLAGGLLGASLLAGGGGGGAKGDAQTGLNNLAGNNASLAKTLGAAGLANMNGNISGSGLNYINRMVKNAQAAIRQRYAGMGMSGSTAEQQDLNAAAMSGVDMQFKIGQEMAQTGLNAAAQLAGQSATIYAALMNQQTQKDSQLGNALANFAGAVVK